MKLKLQSYILSTVAVQYVCESIFDIWWKNTYQHSFHC